MKFQVVGAGMAGLLAGCILRDECTAIYEKQSEIPNNHLALLRFRSSVVGDALNVPFKKVTVLKTWIGSDNPLAAAIGYSLKSNGTATARSMVGMDAVSERYIAPDDLVQRMMNKVQAPIHLGTELPPAPDLLFWETPVISTIPMNALAKMLGYPGPLSGFRYSHGWVTRAKLRNCDVYATVYLSGRDQIAYRASITGDKLIIEYSFPDASEEEAANKMAHIRDYPKNMYDHLQEILMMFGLNGSMVSGKPECKPQQFAKILPINNEDRKRFILWATEKHNIYSFGRYATWRPGLLMDDLVEDLKVIQKVARHGAYDHKK